jgi:hypothetical protein
MALTRLATHELRLEAVDQTGAPTAGRPIRIGGQFNVVPGKPGKFWIDLMVVNKR